MSSFLRVVKFRNYFITATGSFFNNARIIERNSNLNNLKLLPPIGPVKIYERTYAFQHAQPNIDSQQIFRSRKLESEIQFADSMLERGSFLQKRIVERLIKEMSNTQQITPSQTSFLLNCCGSSAILESKVTRRKLVSQIWKMYQDKGFPLDISHYNAFLNVLVESEAEFSPLDFLATLEEKNIKPNRLTYSRLIAKFCQKGDIEGANKILEHMKNNNLEINEYIFSSLILGNSRANDLDGAVAVVDIMKQSNIKIGPDTYAALIQAYSEHKKFDEIDRILADIKKEPGNETRLLEIVCVLVDQAPISVIEKILDSVEVKENLPPLLVKQTSSYLIYSGHEEVAYKIYKTLPRNATQNYVGSFFPKLLATACSDVFKVARYCDEIRENGWNILAYEIAFESYLHDRNFESAMTLAGLMREKGIPLKEHYFYSMVVNAAKEHGTEKVFEIFEKILRLGVPLRTDFFSQFLLPSLIVPDELNQISSLYKRLLSYRELNYSILYNGFIEFLLRKFNIKVTAQFANNNRRGIMPSLAPYLSDIYLSTLDNESVAIILHQLLPVEIRMQKDVEEEDLESKYQGFRTFFRLTIAKLRRENLLDTQMPLLLEAMHKQGTYLIPSVIEYLTTEMGESMKPDIQERLQKLCDPSLVPASSYASDSSFEKPTLRQLILESEADGQIDESLNTRMLFNFIHDKKIDEVEKVLEKFKSNHVALSPPVKLMVLSLYIDENMFEKAEEEFNNFLETYPEAQISSQKIIKIAKMFVDMERFEDAIKCILINSPENGKWPSDLIPNFESSYYKRTLINMLKSVAEKSDISTLERLQEALISNKYAPPQWVMSSMVVHLLNQNNFDEALEYFKKVAKEHRITAGKFELTAACIKMQDTDRLQEILDVSNEIHGDQNTLHDLAFSFIDAGKWAQAEKVLQTNGMRTNQGRFEDRCQYYARTGRIEELKALIRITKSLFNVNRQKFYGYLLDAYIMANDPDNSLDVWNLMQEENISPDDEFLLKLGNYLQSQGRNIPFVVPTHYTVNSLQDALQKQNLPAIKKLVAEGIQKGNISSNLMSQVINTYMRRGMKSEAIELTKNMLHKGETPSRGALDRVFSQLVDNGDVATVELCGKYMNEDIKASVKYRTSLSLTYVNAGRAKELIETNVKRLQETPFLDTRDISFSFDSLRKILTNHPELYSEVLNLIEILKKNENPGMQQFGKNLMENIFEHHYISGNADEAEKIYNEQLQNEDNFRVRTITSYCFREKDTQKLEKLLEIANRKPEGRENLKGFVYSTYIDILNANKKFEEAVNVITKSLESISLENYRHDSLRKLQSSMSLQNLTFPFEIPSRRAKVNSSSSSSSSDDEK